MIHKRSYLIPPQTRRISVAVCFPSASGNCSSVNTLGKMGSVILLVSISEMIFFPLSQWGESVRCQTLHSPISKGIWREKKNYDVSSRRRSSSSNRKRRYSRVNWKQRSSLLYGETKPPFLPVCVPLVGFVHRRTLPVHIEHVTCADRLFVSDVTSVDAPEKAASWGRGRSVCASLTLCRALTVGGGAALSQGRRSIGGVRGRLATCLDLIGGFWLEKGEHLWCGSAKLSV